MIALKIKQYQVTKICHEHGISAPVVLEIDEHLIEDEKTIFGRASEYGVVSMYRGSFEALYRTSLEKGGDPVSPKELLETCSGLARRVLLEELWHCKQFADGQHLVLSKDDAEAEAKAWALASVDLWPDLVTVTDE